MHSSVFPYVLWSSFWEMSPPDHICPLTPSRTVHARVCPERTSPKVLVFDSSCRRCEFMMVSQPRSCSSDTFRGVTTHHYTAQNRLRRLHLFKLTYLKEQESRRKRRTGGVGSEANLEATVLRRRFVVGGSCCLWLDTTHELSSSSRRTQLERFSFKLLSGCTCSFSQCSCSA